MGSGSFKRSQVPAFCFTDLFQLEIGEEVAAGSGRTTVIASPNAPWDAVRCQYVLQRSGCRRQHLPDRVIAVAAQHPTLCVAAGHPPGSVVAVGRLERRGGTGAVALGDDLAERVVLHLHDLVRDRAQ